MPDKFGWDNNFGNSPAPKRHVETPAPATQPGVRKYYTLAIKPNFEGGMWSPQFGDYERDVVEKELEDTREDWLKGSEFKIIKTDDGQAAINAAIDALNRKTMG